MGAEEAVGLALMAMAMVVGESERAAFLRGGDELPKVAADGTGERRGIGRGRAVGTGSMAATVAGFMAAARLAAAPTCLAHRTEQKRDDP